MLRKARLGAIAALAVVPALAIGLAASPASANGGTTITVAFGGASLGGTPLGCTASAHADWEVYPEGDAAVYNITGNTSCSRAVEMTGTVSLTPAGEVTPVRTATASTLNNFSINPYGGAVSALPEDIYTLTYVTVVKAPLGFSWTSVPPECVANNAVIGKKPITCTISTTIVVT